MKKIAFIGFRHGHILGFYNQVKACPDVQIAGAFEDNEEGIAMAKAAGVELDGRTPEEYLADPSIDIIAIGDYYGCRGSWAIKALEAGKHVIADKPLCTSLEELSRIRQLSGEKGLKVGCLLSLRYSPYTATVKELISSGKLGQVAAISFSGQHPINLGSRPGWYFEEGKHGGTVNDLAVHGVDMVEYLTGKRLAKIDAVRTWNRFATNTESFKDCAQMMFELEDGIGVLADTSYSAPRFGLPMYWEFVIWGTEGVVRFSEETSGVDVWFKNNPDKVHLDTTPATRDHIRDFLDEIDGKTGLTITTDEVLNASEDVLTLQKAAE